MPSVAQILFAYFQRLICTDLNVGGYLCHLLHTVSSIALQSKDLNTVHFSSDLELSVLDDRLDVRLSNLAASCGASAQIGATSEDRDTRGVKHPLVELEVQSAAMQVVIGLPTKLVRLELNIQFIFTFLRALTPETNLSRKYIVASISTCEDPYEQSQLTEILYRLTRDNRASLGWLFDDKQSAGYFFAISSKNWRQGLRLFWNYLNSRPQSRYLVYCYAF